MTQIIAEVKTQSPYGFVSKHSLDTLIVEALTHGDIVAIHTDPSFGGSFDLLKTVCKITSKRVLAKGFHRTNDDVNRAFDCGATFVLVVDRIPVGLSNLAMSNLFIEPYNPLDVRFIRPPVTVVINRRQLNTGVEQFVGPMSAYRNLTASKLCQASFIQSRADIDPSADYALVGSYMYEFFNGKEK